MYMSVLGFGLLVLFLPLKSKQTKTLSLANKSRHSSSSSHVEYLYLQCLFHCQKTTKTLFGDSGHFAGRV